MELAAIGRSQFLLGFSLAGVKTMLANKGNVMSKIKESKDKGILIIDAELLEEISLPEREEIEASVEPVIITLAKDDKEQAARLRRTIKNTLGVDLLK